jgi:hypothetical protein
MKIQKYYSQRNVVKSIWYDLNISAERGLLKFQFDLKYLEAAVAQSV